MLLWRDSQLVVEEMLEDLLDALEVNNDAALHGLFGYQQVLLCLRLLANIAVLLVHSHKDARRLGFTDDHGNETLGGVVTCEACFESP